MLLSPSDEGNTIFTPKSPSTCFCIEPLQGRRAYIGQKVRTKNFLYQNMQI